VLTIRTPREYDRAVIQVQDTGRGIEPEMLDRVFDTFFQCRREQSGLGLGLTLVKRLVSLHQGDVEATSAGADQGSTFSVTLPLSDAPTTAVAQAQPQSHSDSPLEIVLVEDNDDIRNGMAALLSALGHRVSTASSGEDGLGLLRKGRPDVALVDIALPKLSGYDLAKQVRAREGDEQPYLVAMTGFGQAHDRERALAAGFDEHLVKPVSSEMLREILSRIEPRVTHPPRALPDKPPVDTSDRSSSTGL
jgi:CheY-like chemotaxis protein